MSKRSARVLGCTPWLVDSLTISGIYEQREITNAIINPHLLDHSIRHDKFDPSACESYVPGVLNVILRKGDHIIIRKYQFDFALFTFPTIFCLSYFSSRVSVAATGARVRRSSNSMRADKVINNTLGIGFV